MKESLKTMIEYMKALYEVEKKKKEEKLDEKLEKLFKKLERFVVNFIEKENVEVSLNKYYLILEKGDIKIKYDANYNKVSIEVNDFGHLEFDEKCIFYSTPHLGTTGGPIEYLDVDDKGMIVLILKRILGGKDEKETN